MEFLGSGSEELGFVHLARSFSFGRKRIIVSNGNMEIDDYAFSRTLLKRQKSIPPSFDEKSVLETLPQDILIKILCGVDHEDLKQLLQVSKSISEATSIAKKWHFEYSTPRKLLAFRNPIEDISNFDEPEAPNAPKQPRWSYRSRLSDKKLADISVALFDSPEEEQWPRRELFT